MKGVSTMQKISGEWSNHKVLSAERNEFVNRWPHIKPYLRLSTSGWIENDIHRWLRIEATASPAVRAATNDEWADFFEWQLEQRAEELATDRVSRHLVAQWTDDMAYCCRRLAMMARGEDPGEAVPQHVRRPDLEAEGRAIIAGSQGTTGRASSKMAPASSAL